MAASWMRQIALILIACLVANLCIIFLVIDVDNNNNNNNNNHPVNSLINHKVTNQESSSATTTAAAAAAVVAAVVVAAAASADPFEGTLNCQKFGGPDASGEMIYWRDIPSDWEYTSPAYYSSSKEEKFLLWDIDPAGMNNKRISLENFLIMAHVTGRTFVLPPKTLWWGLSNNNKSRNNNDTTTTNQHVRWSFSDLFTIDEIQQKQKGLKIISTRKFLEEHAMRYKLKDNKNGIGRLPPNNRTNWDSDRLKMLKEYLGTVTKHITWRYEDCLGAFPSTHTKGNMDSMKSALHQIINHGGPRGPKHWIGRPNPVNATMMDRMEEVMTNRKELCFYDESLQRETYAYFKIVYDPRNATLATENNIRLLVYYYLFFFFQDYHQDLWTKRFVRDRIRYKDELQCAAGRVVQAVRRHHANNDDSGAFDSLHVRRKGQFEDQYGNLTTATEIIDSMASVVPSGSVVYVATDETDRTFFEPLQQKYTLFFLSDFEHLIPDIDVNLYSIIDQLVASRGRTFFGAFCSTFTGHINRLRGYHSQKSRWPGFESGALLSSYFYNYNKERRREKMRTYHPPVTNWFFREYPIAWRDIDHDVPG